VKARKEADPLFSIYSLFPKQVDPPPEPVGEKQAMAVFYCTEIINELKGRRKDVEPKS
jgi:hypothetical protein